MKICLIGNYAVGSNVSDGQRAKVRLYYEILKKENNDISLIDLYGFKKKPLSIIRKIKASLNKCDIVILIAAKNGAKILIPVINFLNKKRHKRFIYSLVGTSILHIAIDKLSLEECDLFLKEGNYQIAKKNRFYSRQLSRIDCIIPETDIISNAMIGHFGLNNVVTITNFREDPKINIGVNKREGLVFISRINGMKGIFDLFSAVDYLGNKCPPIDIYGQFQLSGDERKKFDDFILRHPNVRYCGIAKPDEMLEVLSKYNALVFPTRYLTEGVPGVLVESLIAGTPVISSSFPQASEILKDGFDSLFFDMFNYIDLAAKIEKITDNKDFLSLLQFNAYRSGVKYTYSYNRDVFLRKIYGGKNDTK